MKIIKTILVLSLTVFALTSCETEESTDDSNNNSTVIATKNTLSTSSGSGTLNYYSFTSYSLSNGVVYDFVITEKKPTSFQNVDYGTYVRLFIKELPSQNTTFMHRQDADFDIANGEYFFNNARIGNSGSQEWYAPFINSRPTADLKVTIDNGVATFTVIDAELSDNFVAPITTTENFTLSFSVNLSELTGTSVPQLTDLAQ